MAKKGSLVDRVEHAKEEGFLVGQHFTRQLTMDLTAIALNREFGFGAERLKKFNAFMVELYGEFADIWNQDSKDVEYSKDKLDRALRQIYGEQFVPWDARYN